MLAHGGGSIIVIGSYTGMAGMPNFPPAYQAAKAAAINITQALAASWGDRGVRVNAICPGWFPSEMTDAVLAAPIWRDRIESHAPLGRTGDPAELAGPLLLLASDAGSYMRRGHRGRRRHLRGGRHRPYTPNCGLHQPQGTSAADTAVTPVPPAPAATSGAGTASGAHHVASSSPVIHGAAGSARARHAGDANPSRAPAGSKPTPSSRTSIMIASPSRHTATSTCAASACLAMFVSASCTTR